MEIVKIQQGAVFNIPICKVEHIKDAIFLCKRAELKQLLQLKRQTLL
jgi:23S rRNA (guanosine2251-2'-O)-methyltransferase